MVLQRQSIRGTGDIFHGDRQISRVNYSLHVMIDNRGRKEIAGSVEVLDGERLLLTYDTLMLRLDDGRRLRCIARTNALPGKTWQIQGAGDFLSPEPDSTS